MLRGHVCPSPHSVPLQAHAVSGHKAQGQTLPQIVIAHLFSKGVTGDWYCLLKDLGWFYTAASRTKMRTGLSLDLPRHPRTNEPLLPLDHMQKRRLDVLAEMARLEVLHVQTDVRVAPTTAEADARRIRKARSTWKAAEKKFRRR